MNESSNLNSCVIELHYCLNDGSHSMDAFVFNECEREFLAIVREVARGLGIKVEVRTEALGKGGICCWLTFISLDSLCTAIDIAQLVTTFLNTPVGRMLVDVLCAEIKEKFSNKNDGRKRDDKLNLIKDYRDKPVGHKNMKEKPYQNIGKNIEKRRSNFFANLFLCKAVNELIIRGIDETGAECLPEKRIKRDDFIGFIMPDNEVVPEYVNDAIIEIIPPIGIDGRLKWMGRYNEGPILPLTMKDYDFKKSVRTGQIRMEDIVSIRCNLEIRRKIDKECGDVVPKGYRVMDVVDFWY